MIKILIAFAALVASSVVPAVYGSDVEAAWEEFQAHFPIESKSNEDYAERKSNFIETHAAIEEHNKNPSTFKMEHNRFSVMNDNERKAFIGAFPPEVPSDVRFISSADVPTMRQAASLDYRTHTCMQPIKNQRSCGSCWAFAATAVTEFGKCILTGTRVALSEQQMVDCSTANYGCNGGWYEKAWQYVARAGAQATSASYPYTATGGTCKYPGTTVRGAVISTTSPVTYVAARDTTTVMNLLTNRRLVSLSFAVVKSFYSYKSGVYTEPNCGTNILGYHAMTAVGYGSLNGVNYWIIRNSWGSGWGAAGYVLFQRGVNLCGIENWPATTTITA